MTEEIGTLTANVMRLSIIIQQQVNKIIALRQQLIKAQNEKVKNVAEAISFANSALV